MKRFRYGTGILAAFWAAAAAQPVSADIVILGSTAPELAVGAVLKDSETLNIPAGSSVRIMTPSGRTEVLKGPQVKNAGALAGGSGEPDVSLWNTVTARLAPELDLKAASPSATRSMEAPKPSAVGRSIYKFSWRTVPAFAEGDVCVEKGAALELLRAPSDKPEDVTVVDLQAGGRRAVVPFAAGIERSPWPAEIAPRVGGFAIQPQLSPPVSIRLRLIAPLPSPQDAVRVLHGQRCEMQRNALLDALKDPTFEISALDR